MSTASERVLARRLAATSPQSFRVAAGVRPRQQIKAVFLHPAVLAARGWRFSTPAVATPSGRTSPSVRVWLLPAPSRLLTAATAEPFSATVWLSDSVWAALLDGDEQVGVPGSIDLHVITDAVRVAPARIEHVLGGGQVMLHHDDIEKVLGGQPWAIVTHRGTPMAARVVVSDRSEDKGLARLSFYSRLLLGLEVDQFNDLGLVQVSPFHLMKATGRRRRRGARGRIGAALAVMRAVALVVEVLLRPLLRAPEVALRVSESSIGDDAFNVVRIREDALPLLGINVGDEVFLSFGPGHQVAALTLLAGPAALPSGFTTRIVDPGGREDFASDERLLIGVPAPLRDALGIPRSAVVHVRRRLSTLVLGRVNELVLPVGALIFTTLTVPRFSASLAVLGGVAATLLSLLPLRLRQPSRGRWPW